MQKNEVQGVARGVGEYLGVPGGQNGQRRCDCDLFLVTQAGVDQSFQYLRLAGPGFPDDDLELGPLTVRWLCPLSAGVCCNRRLSVGHGYHSIPRFGAVCQIVGRTTGTDLRYSRGGRLRCPTGSREGSIACRHHAALSDSTRPCQ